VLDGTIKVLVWLPEVDDPYPYLATLVDKLLDERDDA
jgi:hypothetical protein